jgi:hypothetical protein
VFSEYGSLIEAMLQYYHDTPQWMWATEMGCNLQWFLDHCHPENFFLRWPVQSSALPYQCPSTRWTYMLPPPVTNNYDFSTLLQEVDAADSGNSISGGQMGDGDGNAKTKSSRRLSISKYNPVKTQKDPWKNGAAAVPKGVTPVFTDLSAVDIVTLVACYKAMRKQWDVS